MSSSSSVAVKRRRLNKKTPAEGAAAEESSVGAAAEEARLVQIIFINTVRYLLNKSSVIGAVISFIVFLTLKVQAVDDPFVAITAAELVRIRASATMQQPPAAVPACSARRFQWWLRYLRIWVEPPPLVVPPIPGHYRRLLWD